MKQNQSWVEPYAAKIELWNKSHKIVGASNPRDLIAQSIEAIGNSPFLAGDCLVDVGAGAGFLGVPWLNLDHKNQAIFVEPDKKKAAFLFEYLTTRQAFYYSRFLVVSEKLEKVPRETIESFAKQGAVFACRAFSGSSSLSETIQASAFAAHNFFVFSAEDGVFLLKSHVI